MSKPISSVVVPKERAYWRTGRSVGRTIYAMTLDQPSASDELIGVMDTQALAIEAVACHNAEMSRREGNWP